MDQGERMNVSPAQAAFLIPVLERGLRGEQAVPPYGLPLARWPIPKAQVFGGFFQLFNPFSSKAFFG